MPGGRVIACVAGLLLTGGIVYTVAEARAARVTDEVRRLCGGRARIVWCQQAAGDAQDVGALGSQLMLMGLDTAERAGPHPLLTRVGNYHKPLITPRGDRVVFTDFPVARIYAVNWNGTGMRELAAGFALDVWLDPATAQEWVYAVDAMTLDAGTGSPVSRFRLDNPFKRETVWDATPVAMDNFRVSADGTKAGALFPWPLAGVLDLKAGTRREAGRGCWPDLSPDDGCLLWVFDGAHRNLVFHMPDGRDRWKVCINGAPGLDGFEVYHPRWSNHLRFMAMTGPYKSGEGDNRIRAGGTAVEVYVGRFNRTLTAVERWVRVTENKRGDFYPDVWIEPTTGTPAAAAVAGLRHATASAAAAGRLTVQARLVKTSVTPTLQSIAPYRQALVVYAYEVERVVAGKYQPATLFVAHWGLVQGERRDIGKTKGRSYPLTVELLDDHPELEGERVIMDMKVDGIPVYYEVGG